MQEMPLSPTSNPLNWQQQPLVLQMTSLNGALCYFWWPPINFKCNVHPSAGPSLLYLLVTPQLLHLNICDLCSFVFLHSAHSVMHLRARPHWDESTSATVEKKQSQVHLQHRRRRENSAGISSREESRESVLVLSCFCAEFLSCLA